MSDLPIAVSNLIKGSDWEIDNPLVEGLLGVGAFLLLGAAAYAVVKSDKVKVSTPLGGMEAETK